MSNDVGPTKTSTAANRYQLLLFGMGVSLGLWMAVTEGPELPEPYLVSVPLTGLICMAFFWGASVIAALILNLRNEGDLGI